MFFEQRETSSVKHRRLDHILLFALRTLMLILLALLFASPFIRRSAAASDGKKLHGSRGRPLLQHARRRPPRARQGRSAAGLEQSQARRSGASDRARADRCRR